MTKQPGNNAEICRLDNRCLIKVSGADAGDFLQNLVTQDIARLGQGQMAYACLLTPQGRILHDFFVSRDGTDGFYLECESARREDLMRRLGVFRLRAKVSIEDCQPLFDVYVSLEAPQGFAAFQDPRLAALGYRFYLPRDTPLPQTAPPEKYSDSRISLGIPEGTPDIKPETDILSDLNLDQLNAVSWDKGCFVGQEVTARVNYRGLVKKRLMIVSGSGLIAGSPLMQGGVAVGEIRAVNVAKTKGLAILKLGVLERLSEAVTQPNNAIISAKLPEWLEN